MGNLRDKYKDEEQKWGYTSSGRVLLVGTGSVFPISEDLAKLFYNPEKYNLIEYNNIEKN